jgi:hypothetical protein
MKLGGGTDTTKLRVELWIEGVLFEAHGVPLPGGEILRRITITIPADKQGKLAKLVFIDDSPTGHLTVDEVFAWPTP